MDASDAKRLSWVAAAGLVAAAPVLVSTTRALDVGWTPVGDTAFIAVRAYDVLTPHSPLLGQWTSSSRIVGEPMYQLGPLEQWLLALPARMPDPRAIVVAIGLVNVASLIGVVALARRRGGYALMLAVAAAVAVMCHSLGAEALHTPWNPSAALLPLTLLMFLSWSIASGDHRLLPLAVVVASFVAQCHLTFLLPVLGLLAVAVVGLWIERRGRAGGSARRWAIAALVVGLVCWSGPLLDQAIHRPGNLALVRRAATADLPRVGAKAGFRAVVRAVGVPPWWLRDQQEPVDRYFETGTEPGPGSTLSALGVLAALATLFVVAVRRHRPDAAAGCAVALVLCGALAVVVALTPSKPALVITLVYTLVWGSPLGMFAWVALAWSAATLFLAGWRPVRVHPRVAVPIGLVAVAAVATAAAVNPAPDSREPVYDVSRTVEERLDPALAGVDTALVRAWSTEAGGLLHTDVYSGIVYALRRRGITVATPDATVAPLLGSWYATGSQTLPNNVLIGDRRPPPGDARLIARISPTRVFGPPAVDPQGAEPPFAVTLLRRGDGR